MQTAQPILGRWMGEQDPRVSTMGDTVEILLGLAGEVDRAVSLAVQVREEVQPTFSAAETAAWPLIPPNE